MTTPRLSSVYAPQEMDAAPVTVAGSRRRRGRFLTRAAERGRRAALLFDAVLAVVLAVITTVAAVAESHPTGRWNDIPAGAHVAAPPPELYALVALSGLVLVWRRRRPEAVLLASLTCVVVYTCLGYVNGASLVNPMFALYAVAAATTTRRAVVMSMVTLVALMAASAAFQPFGPTGGGFFLIPGQVAAALFLGLWVGSRRALTRRETEERARRAVDAERLRIARELHDVIAHTISTINVQAGVAAHVIERRPDQAAEALSAIRNASGEALRELRGILNVLRQADEPSPTEPAPRVAQLGGLIDGATRAGLPTTLVVDGEARPLPPTIDLTAYRIVQESLTNALRYAGPTTATVGLSYGADELIVEVRDHGRGIPDDGGPAAGTGHGIMGMRERAEAAGGQLEVGSDPSGGFRVRAHLPLSSAS